MKAILKKYEDKVPEKSAFEQRVEKHESLLKTIVELTLSRDVGKSEEDYLKTIGYDGLGIDEERAVLAAQYNCLCEISATVLGLESRLNTVDQRLRVMVKGLDSLNEKKEEN